jgi:hypothetical protein
VRRGHLRHVLGGCVALREGGWGGLAARGEQWEGSLCCVARIAVASGLPGGCWRKFVVRTMSSKKGGRCLGGQRRVDAGTQAGWTGA